MIFFELKQLARRMRGWAITLSVTTIMFVAIFPFMGDSGLLVLLSEKLDLIPDFVIRIFGLAEKPDFTEFPSYFNLCVFYLQVKLCTITALLGCEALICEETDGTIEFLYAMPRSRFSIVIGKYVSRVIIVLALNLIYGTVAYLAYRYMGEPTDQLIRSLSSALMPQLSYLMLGMLISALLEGSVTASTSSMSLFFFSFVLGIIPSLMGKWYKLEYLSPNTSIIRSDFMTAGFRPYWPQIKVMAAYSLAAFSLGTLIYCRKDMKLQ